MLKENIVFLREFILEFQTTGACFPTSKWAAQALTDPLRAANRTPKRILELGPGTGSVTVQILDDMIPGDQLTICEINSRFMKALKDRIAPLPSFEKHKEHISFFEGPVQDMPEGAPFDVIVCAIPFLNFELETVQDIFHKLKALSYDETLMTYYEYIGLRKVGKAVSPPERRKRLQEIDSYFSDISKRIRLGRERVWLNLLPINIYTVKPSAA